MPPPRAVICPLCGQGFFKASLPFHMKQCEVKSSAILIPCPGCEIEYPRGEMPQHMQSCKKAMVMYNSPAARKSTSSSIPHSANSAFSAATPSNRTGAASASAPRTLPRMGSKKRGEPDWFEGGEGLGGMADLSAALGGDHGRIPCTTCGRQFNPDRIAIHQRICKKITANSQRRATFNPAKKRLAGVLEEAPSLRSKKIGAAIGRLAVNSGRGAVLASSGPVRDSERTYTSWRDKHREFQAAVKASRQVAQHLQNGGDIRDLPPAAPAPPPSHYIQCRYCHRSFAPDVAERHIPKCKTTINRPAPPPNRSATTTVSSTPQTVWTSAAPRANGDYAMLRTTVRSQHTASRVPVSASAEDTKKKVMSNRTRPQWVDWGPEQSSSEQKSGENDFESDLGGSAVRGTNRTVDDKRYDTLGSRRKEHVLGIGGGLVGDAFGARDGRMGSSAKNIGTFVVGKGWQDDDSGGAGGHAADLASLGLARLRSLGLRRNDMGSRGLRAPYATSDYIPSSNMEYSDARSQPAPVPYVSGLARSRSGAALKVGNAVRAGAPYNSAVQFSGPGVGSRGGNAGRLR